MKGIVKHINPNNGYCAIEIDTNNYTIFDWEGKAVAYLSNGGNNSVNVYSFQGEHLGWFENGIIRDHEGKISLFQKGSLSNILYKLEKLKSLQQITPLKDIQKLEPLKPLYQNYFSNNIVFENADRQNPTSNTTDLYKKNQINPLDNYKGYVPDYNGTINTINSRTEQYYEQEAEMIRKGYVKSYTGNYWVTPEEYQNQENKSKNDRIELIAEYFSKKNRTEYGEVKKGKYNVTLYDGCDIVDRDFPKSYPSRYSLRKTDGLVHIDKNGEIEKIFLYSTYQKKFYKVKFHKAKIVNSKVIIECSDDGYYKYYYLFF